MKVVLAEPGKKAVVTEIGEDLRSMQRAVGGLIQAVYPWQDSAALAEVGLCLTDYSVKTAFHQRAPEIETQDSSCIAADYACDETSEMLPLAEVLAGKLSRNLSQSGEVMVTVEYDEGGRPLRLEQISLAL